MYQKPVSPGTIGNVLDAGFRLYTASLRHVFPAAVLVALALAVPNLPQLFIAELGDSASVAAGIAVLITVPVGYWLMAFAMATLVFRINGFANGETVPLSTDLRAGLARSPWVFGAFILYGLALAGGLILLVIPGIIAWVSLGLFLYAMVVDDYTALNALRRSHKLVWGNWWRTATIFFVAGMVAIVFYVLMAGGLGVIVGLAGLGEAATSETALILGVTLIGFVFNLVVMPLFTALGYSIYVDLKLRREGTDLDARIDELRTA